MKRYLSLLMVLTLLLAGLTLPAAADSRDFQFENKTVTVFEGKTVTLNLLRQGDAASGSVAWTSGNPKVATVKNGTVTALTKGRTTITARLKLDNRTYTATCEVSVQRPAKSITVNEKNLEVLEPDDERLTGLLKLGLDEEGKPDGSGITDLPVLLIPAKTSVYFNATVAPNDASNRKFTVKSSDEEVIRVNNGTSVYAKEVGEAVLTVASASNPIVARKQYHVLVYQRVTGLKVSAGRTTIFVDDHTRVTASALPAEATWKDVTWTSANPKVATVSAKGVVTGVSKGTARITATATDGSKRSASVTITIAQQATGVTIKANTKTVAVGRSTNLTATVLPNNANNKRVVWSSDTPKIATVSEYGRVTGVAPGTAVIRCASKENPDVFTTVKLKVVQLVTSVAFTEREVFVNVGESIQLYTTVLPMNATDPSLTFTTGKKNVATVDANGLVRGLTRGETYVTATAADGSNKSGRVKVNVLQPVEGVHMRNSSVNVGVDESTSIQAVLEPSNASNTRMTWTSADPSIATVQGTSTRPRVTGHRWGDTILTGTTEDGGFTTTCAVHVGSYEKALRITDLYLQDNKIKMTVKNQSNMNITHLYFIVEVYDTANNMLPCAKGGAWFFEGSNSHILYEGDSTVHGSFSFHDFIQPTEQIGRVRMYLTRYTTDTGFSYTIKNPIMNYTELWYTDSSWVDPATVDSEESSDTSEPSSGKLKP